MVRTARSTFLARARVDHDLARDRLAAWITSELDDDQAVLVVDETGDEKSSSDAVGAAHQYSGALGGVACARSPSTSPMPPGAATR